MINYTLKILSTFSLTFAASYCNAQIDSESIKNGTVDISSHPVTHGNVDDECASKDGCSLRISDEVFLPAVRAEKRLDQFFCNGHSVEIEFERMWQDAEMSSSSFVVRLDNEELEIPKSFNFNIGDMQKGLPKAGFACESNQVRLIFAPSDNDMMTVYEIHVVDFENKILRIL
jgi:hypothetical protein